MNVVTDTRAILRIVICTIDSENRQLANGYLKKKNIISRLPPCNSGKKTAHLTDVWHEIIRDAFRILTDLTRLMSTDRIEIP